MRGTTMSGIKLFKLEPKPAETRDRPMVDADVPKVTALVNAYLRKFAVAPHFTEQEVKHHLSVREGVVLRRGGSRRAGLDHRLRVVLLDGGAS